MADDVSRAVGAGSETIVINGKTCKVRPLTIKELGEIERECLSQYKRSFIQTFSDNLDLLPENERPGLIAAKLNEAALFDLKSLPPRFAYDPKKVVVTEKLKQWILLNMDGYFGDKDHTDQMYRVVTSAALDGGFLTETEYKDLTGELPKRTRLPYASWWTTGTTEGRLALVCKSFEGSGLTKDEISTELTQNPGRLLNLARTVEELTVPDVGNG